MCTGYVQVLHYFYWIDVSIWDGGERNQPPHRHPGPTTDKTSSEWVDHCAVLSFCVYDVLPVCVSVHLTHVRLTHVHLTHVRLTHAWLPQEPEQAIRTPGTRGNSWLWENMWMQRIRHRFSERTVSAFNHWAISRSSLCWTLTVSVRISKLTM